MSKTQASLQRRIGRLSMLIEIAIQQMKSDQVLARAFQRELERLKESSMVEDAIELQRRLGRISVLVDRSKPLLAADKELVNALAKEVDQTREIATRLEHQQVPVQERPLTANASGRR